MAGSRPAGIRWNLVLAAPTLARKRTRVLPSWSGRARPDPLGTAQDGLLARVQAGGTSAPQSSEPCRPPRPGKIQNDPRSGPRAGGPRGPSRRSRARPHLLATPLTALVATPSGRKKMGGLGQISVGCRGLRDLDVRTSHIVFGESRRCSSNSDLEACARHGHATTRSLGRHVVNTCTARCERKPKVEVPESLGGPPRKVWPHIRDVTGWGCQTRGR